MHEAFQNDWNEILKKRKKLERVSIISQFCHYATLSVKKTDTKLRAGSLITSIDVDVGNSQLSELNENKNDLNVHDFLSEKYVGKVEEEIVPSLVQFFEEMEIPVTFAIRGQLVEMGDPLLDSLRNSSIKHDIAAHGYYHKIFTSLSRTEAQNELEMISASFNKRGIKPTSFVFPRNRVKHLDLLEKFGYESYREIGDWLKDGLSIRKVGKLYDIHPGFHIGSTYNPIFLNSITNIAVRRKLPFHIWFHPRDIYETRGRKFDNIKRVLYPIYNHAKDKQKQGLLRFETMSSVNNSIVRTD